MITRSSFFIFRLSGFERGEGPSAECVEREGEARQVPVEADRPHRDGGGVGGSGVFGCSAGRVVHALLVRPLLPQVENFFGSHQSFLRCVELDGTLRGLTSTFTTELEFCATLGRRTDPKRDRPVPLAFQFQNIESAYAQVCPLNSSGFRVCTRRIQT
jgi:hypothetical protein